MKGKIITIEGLDGAGKSTQIELLLKYFCDNRVKHKYVHYPMLNNGTYGEIISEFLRGEFGSVDKVHPKLVAILFAEDRKEHKKTIDSWIKDGYWVIMDRYVNSNIAFQCAKLSEENEKKQLKEWILNFEFNHNALVKPTISCFLNVPFAQIKKSLKNTRTGADRSYLQGKKDIHEDSILLQRNVYREYLNLLKEDKNFLEIKCADNNGQWLDPMSIHKAIINKLEIKF